MTEKSFQEFWKLFNAEKFFEAHEVLELLWRETPGPERDFYQGLIQIAAAFVHVQKGTPDGGRKLLEKASIKLKKFLPRFGGVDRRDEGLVFRGIARAPAWNADRPVDAGRKRRRRGSC